MLLFISCVAVLAWPLKLFHCSFQKQRAFGNQLYLVFIFGECKIIKSGVEHTSVTHN